MAKKSRKENLSGVEKPSVTEQTEPTENNLSNSANANVADAVSLPLSDIFFFVALTVLCLLVYGQVIRYEFINFDDNQYVYMNPNVLGGLSWRGLRWAFTSFYAANWHPLTWISHMIDVSLFGTKSGMHHAVNVMLHIVNSFLVFSVFHKLTRAFWSSVLVTFLFALHPVHVESVAWVAERKDVLSTLFWLLTMWAYIRYARKEGNTKLNYALVFLFYVLGLSSKPMLVTLPFVLLLLDYWPLERLNRKKDILPLVVEKLPLFILVIAACVVTVLAQRSGGAITDLAYVSLSARLVNAIIAYAKYVGMFFYPVNLGLFYPYSSIFNLWQFIIAVLFLPAVTALCLWQAKKRKYLLVGWLWFLGTLVPVIGIVKVGAQAMADRYTYIPYFGLFIMVIWGGAEIFEKFKINKNITIAVCCIVLAVLSVMTYKQVSYWKDSETLYTRTISVTERNVLMEDNYCLTILKKNRLKEAGERCVTLARNHTHANAYNTWGLIQLRLQNYDEALRSLQLSVSLDPSSALAQSNLSVALTLKGRLDEAATALQKADRQNNGKLTAFELGNNYTLLAINYLQQKQVDKAIPIFSRALELNPANTEIRTNYGMALLLQDKYDDALKLLDESLRQNPNQAEAYDAIGLIYLEQGKKQEAIAQFEKALELKPDFPTAKAHLEKAKGKESGQPKSPK